MARSVYKICACRDQVKCRHPWWFSFKRPGQLQLRKSLDVVLETHIDSKTVAEEKAERLRIGIRDDALSARTRELLGLPPSLKPVLEALTMRQLLDTYHERHLTATTTHEKRAYEIGAIVRSLLPRPDKALVAFGDWLVSDVTADTLERLREVTSVRRKHTSAKRVTALGGPVAANRNLRLVRAAFNWALDKGLVERTPFKRGERTTVKLPSEQARSRRLQGDEADRLLNACDPVRLNPQTKQPFPEPPWPVLRPLVEAALETGCRRGELLSLQWQQVQLDAREIWLPAGKTKSGRARRVPISTRLARILEMRREAMGAALELGDGDTVPGDAYVFGNELGQRHGAIKTAWRLACERATITDLHFHDLRREAGSRWMDAGVPLGTIQRWLGHTNVAQTSTYLATTTVGEHDAMRRFEERIGRLIPIDTKGATPPHQQASSTKTPTTNTKENTTRH